MKTLILTAILLFTSFITSAQNPNQAAFSMSYAKETAKDLEGSIASIKAINTIDNYFTNLRLGWLYYSNANYQSAEQYYLIATKLKPTSVEALLGLANATYGLKKWTELNSIYQKILVIDPNNTTANYGLALSAYYAKQYVESEKFAQKILKLYPFDYNANLLMAGTKLSLAKISEAKTYYQTVLLISPTDATAIEVLNSLK
jgi:tetratricopeptide (TPR) repeat protein